jgi:hypothetical protein
MKRFVPRSTGLHERESHRLTRNGSSPTFSAKLGKWDVF